MKLHHLIRVLLAVWLLIVIFSVLIVIFSVGGN